MRAYFSMLPISNFADDITRRCKALDDEYLQRVPDMTAISAQALRREIFDYAWPRDGYGFTELSMGQIEHDFIL